jgi:hypothetical protein
VLGGAFAPDRLGDLVAGGRALVQQRDDQFGQAGAPQPRVAFLGIADQRAEAVVQIDGQPEVDQPRSPPTAAAAPVRSPRPRPGSSSRARSAAALVAAGGARSLAVRRD